MTPATTRAFRRLCLASAAMLIAACSAPTPDPNASENAAAPESAVTWEEDERSFADGGAQGEAGDQASDDTPGDFDYFLLALSWSPTYCAAPAAAERDPLQCAAERPFAFIVHGLWPQKERGWPADCESPEPDNVPAALVDGMLDLMPSPRLVEHQWDKHGTCVGGPQQAYFATVRDFYERVSIPAEFTRLETRRTVTGTEVEDAFVAANRGLDPDEIAVTCGRGRLREVRICFTREGDFRQCGADVRDTCGDQEVTMLPVRGG